MNGMPYMDMNINSGFDNYNNTNNIFNNLERMNNKINRLERQIKILENRVNRLANSNPIFLKNDYDDNNNMYML